MKAKKSNDITVQKTVKELDADTAYKYRFCTPGGGASPTPASSPPRPKPKTKETISFALSGDQDARPLPGRDARPTGTTSRSGTRIRAQQNDFNVLMGDTIYSDTEVPGYTLADVALTVKQKWGPTRPTSR